MAASATFRRDIWWVTAFSLFAAIRVLALSAAFPFFNNVDERRHFDLVVKYADGHLPRGAELISPETLPYLSHYASPEFLGSVPERRVPGRAGLLACVSARLIFRNALCLRLSCVLRNRPRLVLGAIGAIAITITVSDLLANRVAFTSAYNWFHL